MNRNKLIALIGMVLIAGGCRKTPVRTESKSRPSESIATTDFGKKRRAGIDFTAHGTTPAWALDLDFTKTMRFQATGGALIELPVPKAQRDARRNGIVLDHKAGANKLRVTIMPTACQDSQSGQAFAYTVEVEANSKRYTGCGAFLNGAARLNDTWVLETYQGQRLHADQFVNRQLPYLQINTKEKRLSGFTGCNTLQGSMAAEGDQVRFQATPVTRMACPYNFESGFLAALQTVTLYRISNNRLTLLADGKYVMTFRKKAAGNAPGAGHASR